MAAMNNTNSITRGGISTDADLMIDIAAGVADEAVATRERRSEKRYPYTELVGTAQIDERGRILESCGLQAKNISVGGICLLGRNVFTAGTSIVMQLVRSDGSSAIVGGCVQHCRYIGEMQHETGVVFAPLPPNVKPTEFIEETGRMRTLHPKLRSAEKSTTTSPAKSQSKTK